MSDGKNDLQPTKNFIDYDAEMSALIDLMEQEIPADLLKAIDEAYLSEYDATVHYVITTSEVTNVSRSK